jgi:tetratricopeptide (TPR) repeat protein
MSVERALLRTLIHDYPVDPDDVVAELGEFVASDAAVLRFRQAMIRDAAYEGLAFRRRSELHGRLAELLVTTGSTDAADIDAILSLHYLRAGQNDQALTSAAVAAESAAAVYANADAAILYARALTAAEQLGAVDADLRAGLLERLGDVQVLLGEYETGDRSYTTACRLLTGKPHALAAIGLKRARSAERRGAYGIALSRLSNVGRTLRGIDDPEADDARLEMRMRMSFTQFRQGRLPAAQQSCLAVIDAGDETRNAATVADALALLDIVDVQLGGGGDDGRARHALRLLERGGDLGRQARVWTQIGYRAYLAGRWNDAVAAYESARGLVERRGDEANVAIADSNLAEILLDQGRLDEAETALRDAIRVWRASGSDNDTAFGSALLGRALARQGRYDESAELIARAREQFQAQGAQTEVVDADAYEAERLLFAGSVAEAIALAEQTLDAALQQSAQPVQGSLLSRIIGGCHDAVGDWAAGDAAYARSLELARSRGADHDLVFTVTAMARRRRLGGPAVDPALLAEVAPLGARLGIVVDLTDAEPATASTDALPRQRQPSEDTVSS